jgi:ABC-type glutathione transport system ATPase component
MNEISFPPFVIGVAGGSGSGKSTVSLQVRHADVILPHGANGPAVDVITTKVASVIGQLKRT